MSIGPSGNNGNIAVFDLDGTITYKDTYVEFLLFCLKKRPLRILRGGELVLYLLLYKTGLRSNHWLKAKYLGTVAGGLGGHELENICAEFCARTVAQNIKPKALAELSRLKAQGVTLVLATASFSFYVECLSAELKMDHLLCSKAKFDTEGRITGALDGKNCIGAEKANRLKLLMDSQGWKNIDSAYSDDIVDLPLFSLAEKAFVVDPKTKTAVRAEELGFPVLAWC